MNFTRSLKGKITATLDIEAKEVQKTKTMFQSSKEKFAQRRGRGRSLLLGGECNKVNEPYLCAQAAQMLAFSYKC